MNFCIDCFVEKSWQIVRIGEGYTLPFYMRALSLLENFCGFLDLSRIFVLRLGIFGFNQSWSVVSNFIEMVIHFSSKDPPDEFILSETSRENRIRVQSFSDQAVNAFRIIPFVHDVAGRFFRW